MQINTFAVYVDGRLTAWARACRGGLRSLDYQATNMLHIKHGVVGKAETEFTPLDWQTERLICQLRQESKLEALAIEHVYIRGHEEKRENEYFKTAFDKVVDRFLELARPSCEGRQTSV